MNETYLRDEPQEQNQFRPLSAEPMFKYYLNTMDDAIFSTGGSGEPCRNIRPIYRNHKSPPGFHADEMDGGECRLAIGEKRKIQQARGRLLRAWMNYRDIDIRIERCGNTLSISVDITSKTIFVNYVQNHMPQHNYQSAC